MIIMMLLFMAAGTHNLKKNHTKKFSIQSLKVEKVQKCKKHVQVNTSVHLFI